MLIARTNILWRGQMYKPGESLPANDLDMVKMWKDAGSVEDTEVMNQDPEERVEVPEKIGSEEGTEVPEKIGSEEGTEVPENETLSETSDKQMVGRSGKKGS